MYKDLYGRKWYKGNLHTHTVLSDGKVTFNEAVSRYRYAGYDFLSITDHWVPSEAAAEKDFLLLSGCEYDIKYFEMHGGCKRKVTIHIVGVGFTAPPKLEKSPVPAAESAGQGSPPGLRSQEIIDAIRAAGGIAFFAHPEWSRNLPSDIVNLHNLSGVEIFNTECGINEEHYDYSGFHVDQLALVGVNLPVLATDDVHHYIGEECRSFIMVQADELSRESILDAINRGRFYASQGPWIQTELKGRTLRVTCTPVFEIRIFSNSNHSLSRRGKSLITGAVFNLPESDYYYRVEVTDKDGNCAWTSPEKV